MSNLRKVRVQLLDENTGNVVEEVDVLTTADAVTFSDGETFQQKLNAGKLIGPKGATGATGPAGPQGPRGETGATGATGPQGAKGNTGTSMRFKGDWSSSVAYVSDSNYIDIVTINGNTYRCKASNTNQPVTNTTYWELIAQKGATGAQGPRGETGATGATGPQGPRGETGATGPKGADGADGGGVKVGSSLSTSVERKLFFKVIG